MAPLVLSGEKATPLAALGQSEISSVRFFILPTYHVPRSDIFKNYMHTHSRFLLIKVMLGRKPS